MASVAAAQAAGVPSDRWTFPLAGVGAADHWYPTNRWAFDESPAMRISGLRTLELARMSIDDCDLIDLYSCFPSIVTLTTEELGIDPGRQLTVTGGLAFAGAPLNFAAGQALVGMVATLRSDPGSIGVVQGNGGHATKHSFGVYSTTPPTTRRPSS